jgi:surfeit locus 1 family protein
MCFDATPGISSRYGLGVRDWSFARKPRWILSHLFVAAMLVLFVWAGFWQLSRLSERKALNEIVQARSDAPAQTVAEALASGAPDDLDYLRIEDSGQWVEPELVRVANRSQGGRAGDWQVGTFRTADGVLILVNRGFLGREDVAGPATDGAIEGWLQKSRSKEGYFGVADSGEGERVPRLNVEALTDRAGGEVAPLWLRLGGDQGPLVFPEPVPLPPTDDGAHFSYAMQWFTFATLTSIFYYLILRKRAGNRA